MVKKVRISKKKLKEKTNSNNITTTKRRAKKFKNLKHFGEHKISLKKNNGCATFYVISGVPEKLCSQSVAR